MPAWLTSRGQDEVDAAEAVWLAAPKALAADVVGPSSGFQANARLVCENAYEEYPGDLLGAVLAVEDRHAQVERRDVARQMRRHIEARTVDDIVFDLACRRQRFALAAAGAGPAKQLNVEEAPAAFGGHRQHTAGRYPRGDARRVFVVVPHHGCVNERVVGGGGGRENAESKRANSQLNHNPSKSARSVAGGRPLSNRVAARRRPWRQGILGKGREAHRSLQLGIHRMQRGRFLPQSRVFPARLLSCTRSDFKM